MTESKPGPDGFAQIQRMLLETGFNVPIGDLMQFQLVEVERGRAVFAGQPDHSVNNPMGSVHGGYAATLLDSACGIATLSMLGPARGYTTLELKVSYLKALSNRSGTVSAAAQVRSIGRRIAFVEAELHDEAGRLCATASSTLLVFDLPPDAPPKALD